MDIEILHDKSTIFSFLRHSPELQLYCIGDLDDFFWPKTIWYALVENNSIRSLALLYVGMEMPTLLTFHENNAHASIQLLEQLKSMLPVKFLVHLSVGLMDVFGKQNLIEYYGCNYKMALKRVPPDIQDENIRRLTTNDLQIIQDFYAISYPHNWFDKRMLGTNKYFGYFVNHNLVGVSGVHVYSGDYKVAALGNIATHPEYRGQQIGFKLTSRLCSDLHESIDYIGLNVRSNNELAIKCYKKVGFEIIGTYDEAFVKSERQGL